MNRYLVQFKEHGREYFKTDCAFREGQVYLAILCVLTIVDGLSYVVEGQVLDAKHRECVFHYPLEK